MKYFSVFPNAFTQSLNPWQAEHWTSVVFDQSQAASPTDHLRRRQQTRRLAPIPCPQIRLTFTPGKIRKKDQRQPSKPQPETVGNISSLTRSPSKDLAVTGQVSLSWFPRFQLQPPPNTKTESSGMVSQQEN